MKKIVTKMKNISLSLHFYYKYLQQVENDL